MKIEKNTIKVAIFLVCLFVYPSFAKYSGGSGTEPDPYLISTPQDMNAIGADVNDWNKCFKLISDINMACYTGTQYKIIGNRSQKFTGIFDGDWHVIKNFNYKGSASFVRWIGLFGHTYNATIKNLGMKNVDVNAVKGGWVGALIGEQEYGVVSNCYCSGNIKNTTSDQGTSVGGLIGVQYYGTDSNCYSKCNVQSFISSYSSNAGSFAGAQYYGTIRNCYSTGSVYLISSYTAYYSACGGFIGSQLNYSNCIIESCYSTGRVNSEGDVYSGGFLGQYGGSGSLMDCFWDVETSGINTSAGGSGIVGKTTTEMEIRTTFTNAGWDFINTWDIGENQTYPFLRKYNISDLNRDKAVNMFDFAIFAENWLVEK